MLKITKLVKGLITASVISLSVLNPSLILANDLLQVVRETMKGHTNQLNPVEIEIAPGHGVTISFLPSTQYISHAWLDNPAFLTLDGDGCLTQKNQDKCTEITQVLHLKRINELAIPGLPKTSSTLLTVVTTGPSGGGIYLFRIVKAKRAKKLIYEIVPPSSALVNGGSSDRPLSSSLPGGFPNAQKNP